MRSPSASLTDRTVPHSIRPPGRLASSALTVQQLQSSIAGPGDLPGKTIATAPGSVAATYLTTLGIPYVPVNTADEAYDSIVTGKVQAIVYDAPTLQWWAAPCPVL